MCGYMQHIQLNLAAHLDPGTNVDRMVIEPTFGSITIVIFFMTRAVIFLFLWRDEYARTHACSCVHIANAFREGKGCVSLCGTPSRYPTLGI
jgi:hypothetical protein